jgi:CheY-like chemotaxis protein
VAVQGVAVLVVEDDPDSREVARRMLTHLGAQVAVAADGREGLAKLHTHRADLVLCDLMMPGMNGFEFAGKLRQIPEYRDIPLIAVSALREHEARGRSEGVGYDGYVEKPINWDQLTALVRRLLARRARPPAGPTGGKEGGT